LNESEGIVAHNRELVVLGRAFDGFERSFGAQLAALDGLSARHELIEIGELERRVVHGEATISGEADVLLVITDWLPALIAAGAVRPLEPLFGERAPDGWPEAWVPALRRLQEGPNGHSYGIPYHDGPMLFLYRRDLYEDDAEQAGFAERFGYLLAPPTTWTQFADQASWFDRPEQGLRGTVQAGFPDEHNNVYDFLMHLWSRGGELVTQQGRSGLDTPQARAAVEFLADLWHGRSVVDPAAASWDSVQSGIHFADGEAAMMVNWCGFAALASDPASPTHGRIGCAPVPGDGDPEHTPVTMNAYWVLAVPAGARDPERSAELIRQITTQAMDVVTALSGGSATRLDSWADPQVAALAPYYAVLAEAHRNSRSVPVDARWPQMAGILNEMMRRVVTDGAGEAALAAAHRQLASLLGTP
jgi:multiple sugar transport system substrate-binding protein